VLFLGFAVAPDAGSAVGLPDQPTARAQGSGGKDNEHSQCPLCRTSVLSVVTMPVSMLYVLG
jgi:hypothetical protein